MKLALTFLLAFALGYHARGNAHSHVTNTEKSAQPIAGLLKSHGRCDVRGCR